MTTAEPSQRTFDFDRISLNKCLAAFKDKRLKTLFRGLLLTAAEEPWRVDDIDDDGVMILSATHETIAEYAGCVRETIIRNHKEQALVTHSALGNSMSQWMFRLRDVLPQSAVGWFRDLVENSRMSLRQPGNVTMTFPKCHGDISQNVTTNVTMTFRPLHEHAKNNLKTHEHDHESMPHEFLRNSSENETQESQVSEVKSQQWQAVPKRVRFSRISREHLTAIVRRYDVGLFLAFFRDAVAARWANDTEHERLTMAALFHQVVRNNKAGNPGAVINASWKARHDADEGKQLMLSVEDDDFARQLLRPVPIVAREMSADEDPEAADRREEKLRGQLQRIALLKKFADEKRPA